MRVYFWLALLSFRLYGLTAAYVSFEHPDGWRCELLQGAWICQSTVESERRESLILSIATQATEWDSLENYENHLKQPRTIQDEEGNTLISEVRYARRRNINGFNWIDSLQKNSELPGFWVRYLATVQNRLGILVTYIVSEERYTKLAPVFDRLVATLKPNAEFNLNIATEQKEGPIPGSTILGPAEQRDLIRERLRPAKKTTEPKPIAPLSNILVTLLGLGLVLGAAWYLLRRRKRSTPTTDSHRKVG